MPVNLAPAQQADLLAVSGIELGVASAGIKHPDHADLVLMRLAPDTVTAAVYTQNAFCAAPVTVAKRHQSKAAPAYLLINSGNANAGTGQAGLRVAEQCCQAVAELTGADSVSVLPFSTGVIGQPLPLAKINHALPKAWANLAENNWLAAAQAIMTTDLVPKAVSKQVEIDGITITVTGMAKGSGMICPDMATMLAYIATDAAVDQVVLDTIVVNAVAQSFNRITVDGDTSTNDACVVMATGKAANNRIDDIDSAAAKALEQLIKQISQQLAQAIVRDGEGATKFVEIKVTGGNDNAECRQVAYTIAHSPLVKTALFAADPNWGRILAAVGRAGITDLDLTKVTIYLGDVCIIRSGEPDQDYREQQGQQVMQQQEIIITVDLARGPYHDSVWTCDLSYDYVKINSEYRS